jgi:hypothetical protein
LESAKVYKLGASMGGDKEDILTLLLTEEDMILLSSLLETTVPYTITANSPNERRINALFIKDLPDGRLSVTLPVTGVTAAENAQWQSGEGANRVDIVADMIFHTSDADPQLVSYRILEDVEFITTTGGGGPSSDPNAVSIMTATIAIEQEDLNSLYSAVHVGIPLTAQLRAE